MPLPKQRHSKARGGRRRTHWKLKKSNLSRCPQCKTLKPPHTVCPVCGTYNGRQILEIKTREKKKKES